MKKGRNINRLSIPQRLSPLGLGPPDPWLTSIAKETLGFRCPDISSGLRLLMPTFSLLLTPPFLTKRLHCQKNAPLPHAKIKDFNVSVSSVLSLAPLNFQHEISRLVSCYAFFKGWLLLSQPPSCLSYLTSFST